MSSTLDERRRSTCEATSSQPSGPVAVQLPSWGDALAGAFAGVCVTMALHPIDTIKVLVQADLSRTSNTFVTAARAISIRGIPGLYRGVLPALATSAPISAIYTSTYEGAKAALLPLCPPGGEWAAHCLGGACASLATSFVFTPSEAVKARLQVGHFASAPQALRGIVVGEGLGALYRGWGAVLCRNVPQSVIKFFLYERLRGIGSVLFAQGPTPPWLSLAVGAVAGSGAALCTTPFDVAKTRLQTSGGGAGTLSSTLASILRSEGPRGLYRGLGPRLLIYLLQGAIFFGAYEATRNSLDILRRKAGEVLPRRSPSLTSPPPLIDSLSLPIGVVRPVGDISADI